TTMCLAVLLGWTSARGMQIPLAEVARITTRVARGDLTDPGGRVLSDDAFGELATEIATMRSRLAQTVRRVVDLSGRVASSAQETIDQAQQIGLGAEAQVASVTTVGQANEALDKGLKEVADIIRRVATTFRQATDSGAQVEREFDDLTRDVEALASEASEAAAAVAELSKGTGSVAGDVAGLSEAAERATRAAGDVDKALGGMREHAGGAAEAARRTITAAKGGAESVRRTVEGIGRIREGSENAVARVEDLSRRISEVDRVLAVIDDIAEKTNLLALNASIIAAQAGEQGKSFAVVAGEVRDLATRTAASTREISETISEVRRASREVVSVIRSGGERIEEGVGLAGEAERSLEEILITTYVASAAAGEIATSTDLQARNVSKVREEIDQLAAMASRIAEVGVAQADVAAGAKRAAERIASLTVQVNHVIASLTERNRTLLTTFTNMGAPVALVEKTLDHQAIAMEAINQENSRIRDIAMASSEVARRLDDSARTIEEAAESLASEVHYFRL
ncbi:MAG: methyl-accepting chemotaxis protein, partial [Myxococcota bacterium]